MSRLHSLLHSSRYSAIADKLGIASAFICAIHCLVIPVLVLLKHSWRDSVAHVHAGHSDALPVWWHLLDYLFLVVGLVAVAHASGHAAGRGVRISLWLFLLCLAVAVVFEDTLHWIAYIASGGLIITHFVNIRRHRRARL